jgi:hypothetical protein
VPQRAPGPFRKLDAIAVLTGRLLPAPLEARFPRREDVPKAAVDFVAGQVKVDPALFAEYA